MSESSGLPTSIHIEVAILGAMLLEAEAVMEATAKLTPKDFSLDSHQRIYRAIIEMMAKGHGIDYKTVRAELERRREIDAVGGPAYLAYLTEGIPRNLNIESYVRIVKDKSLLRDVMRMAERATIRAADESEDAQQLLAELQEETFSVQAEDVIGGPVGIAEVVPKVVEQVIQQREQAGDDEELGLVTGLKPLDRSMGGLREHEYTILAGESGDGKTALATQITIENAMRGVPCAWFSLEMTRKQLVSRMFASLGYSRSVFLPRVTAAEMRDPRRIPKDKMYDFYRIGDSLAEFPIWIDDDSSLELTKMMARARLLVRRHKVKLVVFDYLQLVHVADSKLNETQKTEKVTYALRNLAKVEPVHVLALSQYSYEGKLKNSSSLRQSCQNLLKLNREKVDDGYTGSASVLIDKMREGVTGKVTCRYDTDFLRFY